MQMERYRVFKAQDHEKGYFDIAIEIQEKKIYAHKFVLATASETFNAMLSDRWNGKSETIKIENPAYSYETFSELLTYIYSNTCTLTNENIFVLTDMAEFYGITFPKDLCRDFLRKMEIDINCIDKLKNFRSIIESEEFVKRRKSFIQLLSTLLKSNTEEEKFFDAVCKWAEYQTATVSKAGMCEIPADSEGSADKNMLDGILCNINFSQICIIFVKKVIYKIQFVLSSSELYSSILKCKRNDLRDDKFFEDISFIDAFKCVYQIAEKQVIMKQKASKELITDIAKAIKNELSEIFSNIKFQQMSYKFVKKFIVPTGILSKEEVKSLFEVCVKLDHNHGSLFAVFEDTFDLMKNIPNFELHNFPSVQKKFRFPHVEFFIPHTPSTLIKRNGIEWYLVIEKDGILGVKFHSTIVLSDYLIAEMKAAASEEFIFDTSIYANLSMSYKNV